MEEECVRWRLRLFAVYDCPPVGLAQLQKVGSMMEMEEEAIL